MQMIIVGNEIVLFVIIYSVVAVLTVKVKNWVILSCYVNDIDYCF